MQLLDQIKQVLQHLENHCGDEWADKKIILNGIIQIATLFNLQKHIKLKYFDIDKKLILLCL